MPIQGLAAAVVAHGGARIGVAGGFLDIADGDASIAGGGDEGVAQRVRSDVPVQPNCTGDTTHDPAGGMAFMRRPEIASIDQDDPDAAPLANSPVVTSTPPRRLDARVPSLAGYRGAVLHRAEAPLFQRFQAEVVSALVDEGLLTKQAAENAAGQDVDFVIEGSPDWQVLIEIKVAERRNLRYRIAEALGVANLWGRPLVLILGTRNPRGLGLVESIGFVPVFPVDWTRDGVAGVRGALARATAWSPSPPP